MPKRQATYKVPCDEVQGEDSWVELKYMTWGENKLAMAAEYKSDVIITDHLVSWNWVDSEGAPLGLSVDVLFETERRFLLDMLFNPPSMSDSKN